MKAASQKNISPNERITLLAGFFLLVLATVFNSRAPFYDEIYYLENVSLIHKYGLGKEYLIHLIGSAGPLYSIVHYLLEPITNLRPPWIRMVNLVFLGGTLLILGKTVERIKYAAAAFSWYTMAIPMTYVIGGLALTEMPAMFFLSAAFYFLARVADGQESLISSLWQAVLAGTCMSFAILGRQPYLLALAAFPIPFLAKELMGRRMAIGALAISFSLILPAYVFYIWKGFVAPGDAAFYEDIKEQGTSFAPQYVVLCISYFALLLALISPAAFIRPKKKLTLILTGIFIVGGIINYLTRWVVYLPLKPYTGKLFSSEAQIANAEVFSGTLLIVLALYLIISLGIHALKSNYNRMLLFYTLALLMIAFSCIKITYGFSSRYAAQAIPVILPLAAFFYQSQKQSWIRAAAGALIGLLSLGSFIFQEYLK